LHFLIFSAINFNFLIHGTIYFAEKDFSRILTNTNGYVHVFLDRIRERNWYGHVYDNSEFDAYYYPELVKKFYTCIDTPTIDLGHHQFTVHFDTEDIIVKVDMIEDYTQIPSAPRHNEPLPFIEYMTIMGARCMEQDCGLNASITFCNIHCVARWVQRNILGLDHTTSFNRPVLQVIHSLMTRQHTVCLNKAILQSLITNSQRTRGAKYSYPVLVTVSVGTFYQMRYFLHMTESLWPQESYKYV